MTAPTAVPPAPTRVAFRPRRLGHVNFYVGDLDRTFAFYSDVLGLQLVFDEKELFAKFLSNGNSHHDVALMQTTTQQLTGRDGKPQGQPGRPPGLNHLAFEMPSEAELVAGIMRARAAGVSDEHFLDHQISRSAYLRATDGIEIEVYADATPDWRATYAGLGTELMSERWEPSLGEASEEHYYSDSLEHQPAADGLARPLRVARAALVVADLDAARRFFVDVIGLEVLAADDSAGPAGGWSILSGALGLPDLLLLAPRDDEPTGFHHFGLQLADVAELEATEHRLAEAGVPIERHTTSAFKHGLVLRDPEGMLVELFATISREDAPNPPTAADYRAAATTATREYLA